MRYLNLCRDFLIAVLAGLAANYLFLWLMNF